MSAPSGPRASEAIFSHTDPFEHDRVENPDAAGDEDSEEGLRLAGVRSNNPFAATAPHASDETGPLPESAVSPTAAAPDAANIGDALDDNGPPTAVSPGAGRLSKPNPFDSAFTDGNTSSGDGNNGPPSEPHPVNSHVNGDRSERGTDIYANADPLFSEVVEQHSGNSGRGSDGDSVGKSEKARVAFAGEADIDETPTRDDSSTDNVIDKIKSTFSSAKDKIHIHDITASGPFKRLNPTKVRMNVRLGEDPDGNVGIIWRSRDNRKGRNSVAMPKASMAYPNLPSRNRPVYSSSFRGVGRNLYRMMFTFPYWDMAWWSGFSYTWGSILFVIDSVWAWAPVGWDVDLGGIETYGVGILFFIGALFYQVGATMAYLEAVNDGSFHGSAMKRFLEGHEIDKKDLLDEKIHHFFHHLHPLHAKRQHAEDEAEEKRLREVDPEAGWKTIHRRERPGSIYPGSQQPGPRRGGVDLGEADEGESHEYLTWRWWPTWHALRTHHAFEIGYIACSVQLFGATLYSWCGLDSIPGISTRFTDTQWYGAYYMPEMLGSTCFLTASIMFLLETQEKWYKPQVSIVGWWIGIWAMVGSLGFLLIGVFGVIDLATGAHWAEYQSECSSTWGSFAYLLSSLCQLYEAVNKHPIEELLDEPGEIKSYQVHLP